MERSREKIAAAMLIQGILSRLCPRLPEPAGKDVNPEFVLEPSRMEPRGKHPVSLKRTPCISMAEENVSGSLHSASVATAPSSSVEMTKRGLRSRAKQNTCCRRCFKPGAASENATGNSSRSHPRSKIPNPTEPASKKAGSVLYPYTGGGLWQSG